MESELLLNSWKEIALYLGRSERTVQRWEKHFGLPVRRPAGKSRSAVIALPSELQAWTKSTPICSAEAPPSREPVLATRLQPDLRPTLLCIDDHPEGLAVRKALLEAVGYNVLTACNGRSGLRLFEKKQVDLVMLDYSMPDLDGETVAHMLHERNPHVPILLLSSSTGSIPSRLLKLVDNFVQKGQPVGILLSAISELCSAVSRDISDPQHESNFQARAAAAKPAA